MRLTFDGDMRMMYELTCRICGEKFKASKANAVYCSDTCRAEGRRIIWRWKNKARKLAEFKKMCEGNV